MISKESFFDSNIRRVCEEYKTPYELTQRAIYAFGLVEALRRVKLDFVFKGGSSMAMLFETPKRLSTDVDILVLPSCDIDSYVKQASALFPFVSYEESVRKTSKTISKKHYKFHYKSPNSDKTFTVILDVLFAENGYAKTQDIPLKNKFLLDDGNEPILVTIPVPESLLGDKLTAFAPHTIGINFFNENFSNDKRLEVIKQFYDVAVLFDICHDFDVVKHTYLNIAKKEIEYRGNKYSVDECLEDTFNSALAILSLGKISGEDYRNYIDGFKRISEHIVGIRLNPNNAYIFAARIMLLSAAILKDIDPFALNIMQKGLISDPPYNKINRLMKIQPEAFNVAVTAIEIKIK